MKLKRCVYCNHSPSEDKTECELVVQGKYHYFEKEHRYSPFTKKELKESERIILKYLNYNKLT